MLSESLAVHAIKLVDFHVVDTVGPDGRWHGDGGSWGTVDDPSASPLAMAAVLEGRRLYARRQDLQKVIEVTDAAACEALAEAIRGQDDTGADATGDIEYAMAAAARAAAGEELADAVTVRLARALVDPQIRDVFYALAVGDRAADAEALWAVLARTLPAPWRVEALVLLAFSAYARGDGPLAGVTLEAALRCDVTHRMAGMLDTALQSGMRPEQIRELATSGYRLAKRLGIEYAPTAELRQASWLKGLRLKLFRPFRPSRRGPSRVAARPVHGPESRSSLHRWGRSPPSRARWAPRRLP